MCVYTHVLLLLPATEWCSPPCFRGLCSAGSGIMDEADFDLPAAVLRRVSAHTYTCVWLCVHVLCACWYTVSVLR